MTRFDLSAPLLFALACMIFASAPVQAQERHSAFVEADYTWLHTNLLPGCNCFGMQGGSVEAGIEVVPRLSALVDVTITHRGSLTPSGYGLTQSDFTAGLRYVQPVRRLRIGLFGEALIGGAHAAGTLAPSRGNYGDDTTFAFQTGGGVSLPIGRRLTLVPAHLDYLVTTFGNGDADHQNQLRYSAGLQFQLRR